MGAKRRQRGRSFCRVLGQRNCTSLQSIFVGFCWWLGFGRCLRAGEQNLLAMSHPLIICCSFSKLLSQRNGREMKESAEGMPCDRKEWEVIPSLSLSLSLTSSHLISSHLFISLYLDSKTQTDPNRSLPTSSLYSFPFSARLDITFWANF